MKHVSIVLFIVMVLVIVTQPLRLSAESLYVDSVNGSDLNPGNKEKPLRTIGKAADIVNGHKGVGPTTIKIGPGVYNSTERIVFNNARPYTRLNRLILESTILPDDPQWQPKLMPIILSTEDYAGDKYGKYTYIFKMEVNHVTIRGLKFLGNPVPHNLHFPIARLGRDKEDLIVTQCLFVGDIDALPIHVPILANGHELVVDHCGFYKCKNSVLFCNARGGKSKRNAMRYCIVDGNYSTGVWTYETDEDFEFHHNIITRCLYTWMRGHGNQRKYKVNNCVITGNKYFSGYGLRTGEYKDKSKYIPTGPEVTYERQNVIETGMVVLEKGKMHEDETLEIPRNYLHPVSGTLGAELGAGLFKKAK
ncbi:MAG: hypothetical protein ACYTEL_20775 [Planctomycetota bacterium]|jgi:hypothetical protein